MSGGPSKSEGAESPGTDRLESASRNPGHFRTARPFLLFDGLALLALGLAGLISNAAHPDSDSFGAPVLFLSLTWSHSGLLVGLGVLTLAGLIRRHIAVAATAVGAVGLLVLIFVGAVVAAHDSPGPLGLDNRDLLLHGFFAIVDFAILYWLLPDVLEGRDWGPRSSASSDSDSAD